MASYDALRHASIGRYLPADSPVHRADPRTKLIGLGLLVIAVVAVTSYSANLALLAVVVGLVRLARLPVRYLLAGVKPALPIILVLSVMQLFFYSGPDAETNVWLSWGVLRISAGGVRLVVVSLLRFVDLILLTSLLTNTTTTSALTYGLERLLSPLDAVGLPGHELSLVGSIALRFVPIMGEQIESILRAQASRGVSLALLQRRGHSRWQLVRNTRRMAALVVPLFVDAYRRADEIALAMQARCYHGGRARTHLIAYHLHRLDYMMIAASALLCACLMLMQYLARWP
jgi:energy-coupling factor transport system permease protein